MLQKAILGFKKVTGDLDLKLLVFLLLFLNIKLPVKILAIVLIYAFQFNFKFGLSLKHSRLPLFYPLIISIAFLSLLIGHNYAQPNYWLVFLTGIGFWVLSLLAIHQVKLMVESTSIDAIHRTLVAFFIINAIVSFANLGYIMWQTGSINPYTYRGMYQAYFINTGDDIKGISFDISSTNAILNAFGVIYFLVKQRITMLMICMSVMLLTFSNVATIILMLVLVFQFIFKSDRAQKSMIVICCTLLVVFMAKVSPQNKNYITESVQRILHKQHDQDHLMVHTKAPEIPIIERPDSLLNPQERKQKIALLYLNSLHNTSKERYHAPYTGFAHRVLISNTGKIYIPAPDTNAEQNYLSKQMEPDRKLMLDFIDAHRSQLSYSTQQNYAPRMPGKLTGMIRSVHFLQQHPIDLIAGAGIGNFSSKIAFRAVGLGTRGKYPQKYIYINHAFLVNHLDLYLSFFSKGVAFRSIMNNPFSVYDQMLSEYGIAGLLTLLICYLGYWAKRYRHLSYGIPMLLLVTGIFFCDYWFEQLSVMILFELMMFLNIKECEQLKPKLSHAH